MTASMLPDMSLPQESALRVTTAHFVGYGDLAELSTLMLLRRRPLGRLRSVTGPRFVSATTYCRLTNPDHFAQLGAVALGAARRLRIDLRCAGGSQIGHLSGDSLAVGTHPRISENGHGKPRHLRA